MSLNYGEVCNEKCELRGMQPYGEIHPQLVSSSRKAIGVSESILPRVHQKNRPFFVCSLTTA